MFKVARLAWEYPRKTTANEEGVTAFGEKVNSKNGTVNEGVGKATDDPVLDAKRHAQRVGDQARKQMDDLSEDASDTDSGELDRTYCCPVRGEEALTQEQARPGAVCCVAAVDLSGRFATVLSYGRPPRAASRSPRSKASSADWSSLSLGISGSLLSAMLIRFRSFI
ncbi:general stress protein CsbD [Caballeronia zhejiangensis]|uniref:General stress protein CsbD n=1 Tax=Caballeronia zhejiangensis TaxID=871203 RepID=A0A656Q8D3_9BURK|nr:hypothetical protein BURK_007301 [Burkholderia sp. SJ98]KDR24757.1 general stress protein CsbD [Caballeronia zhejiangensis]